jgi:hypothetical protein
LHRERQSAALGDVSKFVRQHPGELAHRQRTHERQADGQHEIALEDAAQTRSEACGRVHLAIHLHEARHGGAHVTADVCDERKQCGMLRRGHGERVGERRTTRERRLDHEEGDDDACDRGRHIRGGAPLDAGAAAVHPPFVRGEVPPHARRGEHDHAEIDERQEQHRDRNHEQAAAIGPRELGGMDAACEGKRRMRDRRCRLDSHGALILCAGRARCTMPAAASCVQPTVC